MMPAARGKCAICGMQVESWQAHRKTGNHLECHFKGRRKLLLFERGVLWAIYVMVKNTNDTAIAAQILREGKLTRLDCFELPTNIKTVLVNVNLEEGIALLGLDE